MTYPDEDYPDVFDVVEPYEEGYEAPTVSTHKPNVLIELTQADGPPQVFITTPGDTLTVSLRAYVEGANGVVVTTMPLTIKATPQ